MDKQKKYDSFMRYNFLFLFISAGIVGYIIWNIWGLIAAILASIICFIVIFAFVRKAAQIIFGKKFVEQQELIQELIVKLKNEDYKIRLDASKVLDKMGWSPSNDIDNSYYLSAKEGTFLDSINGGKNMKYFEDDMPSGDVLCSDNNCPCSEVVIPRGTGYIYIEQSLVDFRRKYPTLKSARNAMQQKQGGMRANFTAFTGFYSLGPIIVCKKGAKLRNLDMVISAADAKYWWKTGKVPLRATPTLR